MRYTDDGGSGCSTPGSATTFCAPPNMATPAIIATNGAGVEFLFVQVQESAPGCVVMPNPAQQYFPCFGPTTSLGFPVPASCPNYLGWPDVVTGLSPTCPSCVGNPPYTYTITWMGGNDFLLTIA